jgi:hypothetical protein
MRLSSLVVASFLLVSTSLLAQHSVTSSTPSSSSSSASSSHVSSPSTSAPHSSTSGTGSSATHSSSGHSSIASVSHSSSAGSAATRESTQPSRSGSAHTIREPNKTGKEGHSVAERDKKPQPEHKRVFAFLHHRHHRKPAPKGVAQPTEAERKRPACPPGQSASKNGVCVANPTNASNQCAPNAYGGLCQNNVNQCASFRGQLDAAAAELRSIRLEMLNADCSGASPRQECGFMAQRREAAVARYRSIQSGIPANCGALPDPLSL